MTGLIIATHGDLAASALEAAELLVGEQEQVETIGFRPGDSLELLLERFTQAIKTAGRVRRDSRAYGHQGRESLQRGDCNESQEPEAESCGGAEHPAAGAVF